MATVVRGEAALKAKLKRIEANVRNSAPEAGQAGARPVAEEMVRRAPVDDGDLRDSIGIAPTDQGAITGPDAPHTRFVVFGTIHMSPNPFMQDAAASASGDVPDEMTPVIKAAIRRGF